MNKKNQHKKIVIVGKIKVMIWMIWKFSEIIIEKLLWSVPGFELQQKPSFSWNAVSHDKRMKESYVRGWLGCFPLHLYILMFLFL